MTNKGQRWMHYTIAVSPNKKWRPGEPDRPNYHHHHHIKSFNFPDWITEKWMWYIRWWHAKTQVRFPRHYVSMSVCPYYPEFENDAERIRKQSIAAAKAQISRVENMIKEREKELATQLFSDPDQDPIIKKLRKKLEEKKCNLEQIIIGE